jgi:hypothetical protein
MIVPLQNETLSGEESPPPKKCFQCRVQKIFLEKETLVNTVSLSREAVG